MARKEPEKGRGDVAGERAERGAGAATYRRETAGVLVEVAPRFLESESAPALPRFVWSYSIRIANHRDEWVRLLRRYWRLADSLGRVDEVRGDGVVGQQPTIQPGLHFDYASFAPLKAPSGVMGGHFEMVAASGALLTVETPVFSLDSPYERRAPN